MMYVSTALNRKYLEYTAVMLTSLCENNTEDDITVFLLHHELKDDDFVRLKKSLEAYCVSIEPIQIDRQRFDNRIGHSEKWTMEAYYRLMLFDLLPNDVDRLLYLDVDMIVNQSIHEFYHQDFHGKHIFVCENAGGYLDAMERLGDKQKEMFAPMFEKGFKYFNSGMLLLNVSEMRKKYNYEIYCQAMKEWNYQMGAPDQDLLNYLHWDQVVYADAKKYNYFSRIAHEQGMTYERGKKELCIIHYTDEKPWETKNYHYPIEKIWWYYAKKTSFYVELMEGFIERTMDDPKIENWIRDLMDQVEQSNANLGKALELIETMKTMIQK